MVPMKMTQEKVNGFPGSDVPVNLIKAVTGIQDQIFPFGFDQDTDGIAGLRIVPAVGAQEGDFQRKPL